MFIKNLLLALVLFTYIMCITTHSNYFESAPTISDIFKHESYKISSNSPQPANEKLDSKYVQVLSYITKNNKQYLISDISSLPKEHKTQILCLALNMYSEARGSTEADQRAVAYVTVNRAIGENHYKGTLCGVVWQHAQFSWTTKSVNEIIPHEKEAWIKAQQNALNIYKEKLANVVAYFDITKGATHFYAPKLIGSPAWAKHANNKEQIGGHIYMTMSSL